MALMSHFATELSKLFAKAFLQIRCGFATKTVNQGVAE